jgi:hypothetical protein
MRARRASVQARYSACSRKVAGSLPARSLAAVTAGSRAPKAAGSAWKAADKAWPSVTRAISASSVSAICGLPSFSRSARKASSSGMPASSRVAMSWLNRRKGNGPPVAPVAPKSADASGSAVSTHSGGTPAAAATAAASGALICSASTDPSRNTFTW